ncbi:MAG: HmuY family protein [Paraprevotella sp.]|nr:HmuY family protein [Paraprevotella sp.]
MKKLLYLICLILFGSSCSTEQSLTDNSSADHTVVIPNVKGQWTYFSLKTQRVVGTCLTTDTLAIQSYARRTDWDIAIADGLIRTNSGTSGPDKGGIVPSAYDYEQTLLGTPAEYQVDSIR